MDLAADQGEGGGSKKKEGAHHDRRCAAGKVPVATFEDLNIAQGEDFAPLAQSPELGPDRP
jgi:hypothetical protein